MEPNEESPPSSLNLLENIQEYHISILDRLPDDDDNALPPSSPFHSLMEANEPDDDDVLPLDTATDKSLSTIQDEAKDDGMNEAPKQRSRPSKTPQSDTLPRRHAVPMSEPKPERATKDNAEKKRTRASASDAVLPRRHPAPSLSLSPLHESDSNDSSEESLAD